MWVEMFIESVVVLCEDDCIKEGCDVYFMYNFKMMVIYLFLCLIILSLCLLDEVELWRFSVWVFFMFFVVLLCIFIVVYVNKVLVILSRG